MCFEERTPPRVLQLLEKKICKYSEQPLKKYAEVKRIVDSQNSGHGLNLKIAPPQPPAGKMPILGRNVDPREHKDTQVPKTFAEILELTLSLTPC